MKTKALSALLLPVVAVAGIAALPHGMSGISLPSPSLKEAAIVALAVAAATSAPSHGVASAPASATAPEKTELSAALKSGLVKATFKGNGREIFTATLSNAGKEPVVVSVPPGQIFESDRSTVMVVRSAEISLRPGQTGEFSIQTAATRSSGRIADTAFRFSLNTAPKTSVLLGYVQQHPELTPATIQTAVLALTDNLPLSAVSKFASVAGQMPSRFDTTPFRVETCEIVAALSVLREIGMKDDEVAMTIDPQLKIEAMIDARSRAAAMRYYGITPETEWDFWKTELLSGEASTRHYALYGIARFYPDVALDMLPKWARESRTSAFLRVAAIQALADTERVEALPILNQLADELGRGTEFGRAAIAAAQYLDTHLTKNVTGGRTVAFAKAQVPGRF